MKAVILLAVIPLFLLPRIAAGDDGPATPCAGPPRPAYAQVGEQPRVQLWKDTDLIAAWRPDKCTGWPTARSKLLVALAGRFASDADADALLARFGAVSELLNVRYWSVTDGWWESLFTEAFAVDGPHSARRRADFAIDDMKTGRALYFAQKDNRSSNAVTYRMTLREATADRLVVEMENITPVRFFVMQLYPAGALRSLYFLDQRSPGVWDYYSLMEVGLGTSSLALGYDASYINRATALFRHIAGIPTDRDPPTAP